MVWFLVIFAGISAVSITLARYGVILNSREVVINKEFKWNKYYFFSFLLISLFIGTREGLGVDFYAYKFSWDIEDKSFEFGQSYELGYVWLGYILHYFNLNYRYLFLITSLITIYLFFLSFKNSYYLLPLGIFVFFYGGVFEFVINGVRQGIALMAFLNIFRFIKLNRNDQERSYDVFWILFYFFIGALFHYSILVFVPILFFLNSKIFAFMTRRVVFFGCLLGSIAIFIYFTDIFLTYFMDFIPRYKAHSNFADFDSSNTNFGIGALLFLLFSIFPLMFYNKILYYYPDLVIYVYMYGFGVALLYLFSNNMVLLRLVYYFYTCSIFVYAFAIFYLKSIGKKNLLFGVFGKLVILFLFLKFIYMLPDFFEIQILEEKYSLLFIPFSKY